MYEYKFISVRNSNYVHHFLSCLIVGSKERKKQINKGEHLHENFYRPDQRRKKKKKIGESGEIIRPASYFPAENFLIFIKIREL